jgi:hypothetical protein
VVKYTDCSEYYEADALALGDTMGECVEAKALARFRPFRQVAAQIISPIHEHLAYNRLFASFNAKGLDSQAAEPLFPRPDLRQSSAMVAAVRHATRQQRDQQA